MRHIFIFALPKALVSGVAGVGDVHEVPPEDSARTGGRHSLGQLAGVTVNHASMAHQHGVGTLKPSQDNLDPLMQMLPR